MAYNKTELSPESAFERHVFHRDQFAHYLRWTHILKKARTGEKIVDFGCGQGNLAQVLYRNRFKQKFYMGLDIREKLIAHNRRKFENVDWIHFEAVDLCKNDFAFEKLKADRVCSFEVLEHVGKQNAHVFLQNFKACGKEKATYYLSTPNYDEKVGAAGNHTYDSGDGNGVQVQEFLYEDLIDILEVHFDITEKYGTFASMKDYKPYMNEWQTNMFEALSKYYDTNLISVMMAPMFPQCSRNTLWVMKRKEDDLF